VISNGSVFIYSLVTSRSAVPFRSVFYTVPTTNIMEKTDAGISV